jgi:hypothetical protein
MDDGYIIRQFIMYLRNKYPNPEMCLHLIIENDSIHKLPSEISRFTNLEILEIGGSRWYYLTCEHIPVSVRHLYLNKQSNLNEYFYKGIDRLVNLKTLRIPIDNILPPDFSFFDRYSESLLDFETGWLGGPVEFMVLPVSTLNKILIDTDHPCYEYNEHIEMCTDLKDFGEYLKLLPCFENYNIKSIQNDENYFIINIDSE